MTVLVAPDPLYDAVKQIVGSELASCSTRFTVENRGGQSEPGTIFYLTTAIDSGRARLTITVHRVAPAEADRAWVMLGPNLATDGVSAGFSGLPSGSKARRMASDVALAMHSTDGVFVASAQVTHHGTRPNSETLEADKVFVEGLARRMLAKCRGLQSSEMASLQVNGASVGSITGPRGERLADLVRYCQALNLQLNTNTELGTASFTSGGEQVIIPLAAKKIKDGARWIDSTDISLIKDGKWYVSYAALQEARGQ
jgi:hypothetical protein